MTDVHATGEIWRDGQTGRGDDRKRHGRPWSSMTQGESPGKTRLTALQGTRSYWRVNVDFRPPEPWEDKLLRLSVVLRYGSPCKLTRHILCLRKWKEYRLDGANILTVKNTQDHKSDKEKWFFINNYRGKKAFFRITFRESQNVKVLEDHNLHLLVL